MRKAFELGWSTAYLFGGIFPRLKAIDDMNFIAPVEIGSIVTFTGIKSIRLMKQVMLSMQQIMHLK